MDFTDRLSSLEPNHRMMASWLLSSGMRLSFVFAMKNHMALWAMVQSVASKERIKGVASSEQDAYRRIALHRPGLLVCSDVLATGNGYSLCRRSVHLVPDLRVLFVITADAGDVRMAFQCGAMAVVCEDDFMTPEMQVMQALLSVASGKPYVSRRARLRDNGSEPLFDQPQLLTPRERDVLALMIKGCSDKEIAKSLCISLDTVKDHGKSIRAKYKVKTRLQLIGMIIGGRLKRSSV